MQWLRFAFSAERTMKLRRRTRARRQADEPAMLRKPVLVIGGGIAGITAAVELADAGCEVILVEKSPAWAGAWRACTSISPSCARPPAAWKCITGGCATTRASRC